LPDIADFSRRMSDCGVDAATQVVVYDNEGGIFASRLWWLLRWLGLERVAVLDGGLAGW
jgi:thiosulfate/3-mercaptopyruvate sulfurtransferase